MKSKELSCLVYNAALMFCTECTKQQAYEHFCNRCNFELQENFKDSVSLGAFLCHHPSKMGCVWVKDQADLPVAIHEIYHAVNYMLQRSDIAPADELNDEHYAYYIQWLFTEFLKFKDEIT